MRILLITRYMPPLDAIATHRMYSFAKELSEAGHEVTALTTTKNGQLITPWEFDTSMFELVEVPYFDPFVFVGFDKKTVVQAESKTAIAKLKNLYTNRFTQRIPSRTDCWAFSAIKTLKNWKKRGKEFDLIISSYGPPAAHIIGSYAKKLFHAKWVADYRDLWIENPVSKGIWPITFFESFLERHLMKRADLITTVSEGHSEILQKKFPANDHDVIMNGFSPELLDKAKNTYFNNAPKKIRIVYTGSLYSTLHSPNPVIQAIKEMNNDQIELHFYGRIPEEIHEPFIHTHGPVPLEDAHSIQASADLLLFIQNPQPSVKGVMSGKLFEYLYSPTPILAIGSPPDYCPNRLIAESNAGYNCGTNVETIKRVLHLALEGKHILKKNREKILQFTRKNQAKRLLKHVDQLCCR